ncbi:MFS transporter [Marinimicrobium agarilyticum]|uniref:MFS transporter n=1 Tax=Marinimicrobium agarilyticum TaxID=306546 RepID=UPI0004006225|nr:MFS transporter [Marinimicrobium agarilyticum]
MSREPSSEREVLYPDYPRLSRIYEQLSDDEDARVCKDIPDGACRHQPRNFFAYLVANTLSKIADELSSARLILPWLIGAAGASSGFAGFLVPIREAGVLVPQLVVAAYIRRLARRKVVWLLGALLSMLSLAGMASAAGFLEASQVGWAIVGLLIVYSVARGFCSVAAKDVLGKTVSKTRRGTLMGYSASAAGVATFGVGVYAEFATEGVNLTFFLAAAALLWLFSLVAFTRIQEEPGATEGGGNALAVALKSLGILLTDRAFRRFVLARGLLLSIALVPPFFVLLAQERAGSGAAGLGLMIIASGLAASLSSPVWGRLSDRSSRWAMFWASLGAALLCALTAALAWWDGALLASPWLHGLLFFGISICHGGARLARKVYLVDMATGENRAQYVAVSNTVIGLAMLVLGAVGLLTVWIGVPGVIALLGGMSLVAAVYGLTLKEVSG